MTPWGEPQCYPQVKSWKKGTKKLLANSQAEQAEKRDVRVVVEGEARTASGMPAHLREGLPDQLTGNWLTCDVCGARRLVDKWCKLAVDSCGCGWGKAEGSMSDEVKRVSREDADQAAATTVRWKPWLTDAKVRYDTFCAGGRETGAECVVEDYACSDKEDMGCGEERMSRVLSAVC